jgi:hypothetical protein
MGTGGIYQIDIPINKADNSGVNPPNFKKSHIRQIELCPNSVPQTRQTAIAM